MAQPCTLVIFGASGDLARRKLLPAIYQLAYEKLLPEKFALVGYGRTPLTDEQYREECCQAIKEYARVRPADMDVWKSIVPRISYQAGDYDSAEDHDQLAASLERIDFALGTGGNRLFYLATPPSQFRSIVENLGRRVCWHLGWQRVIIEKPFGRDLTSARALNQLLHEHFKEEQIFRIDHFLGKETVQNLMVMRFANAVFEPIWNYKYIDHVQITVAESIGVEGRGGYYDRAGALRDMVQNHMFQLMSLVAMEPPVALDALSIRDEKVKVFKAIRPMRPAAVGDFTVRGQYGPGTLDGRGTPGYLHEDGVAADSQTETFVAMKLFIDNWRWSGMPFYLRTGKCLPEKLSEVVVRFRSPPLTLFQKQCEAPVYPNDLVIRVQPREGISWRLNGKVPGGQLNIKPVALDFLYQTTFQVEPPDAYERLICDAMLGDQTLFIRGDEAEAAWAVIDTIEQGWSEHKPPIHSYVPGTWGPNAAQDLIELDARRWKTAGDDPVIACSL